MEEKNTVKQKKQEKKFARKSIKITKERAVIAVSAIMVIIAIFMGVRSVTIIRSRPIKFGMENIGEFATQAGYYTNVQVVDKPREVLGIEVPFTQSKYIFSYDGIIKAGMNFEEIETNVDEIDRVIKVKMPEVKILSNEIDEESFEIYHEQKNIFSPLKLEDINKSLIAIEEESEITAIKNGLLENAKNNAEMLITGFLASMYDLNVYQIEFEY